MPKIPIQRPVLNGFQDMRRTNGVAPGEIGDRACDLQNTVVCSRAQVEFFHGAPQKFPSLRVAMGL